MPVQNIPVNVVGSTLFGRYAKTSMEQTYNMIISDEWLVPYAGYKKVLEISPTGEGRGLYHSSKLGEMIAVVDDIVYRINKDLDKQSVGLLDTFVGDIFISENDASQIAICDKQNIYIYNYALNTFGKATIDFSPGSLTFQDGYFISPDLSKSQWRLSDLNNGLSWPAASQNVGVFQTKADIPIACVSAPGKGGNLFVMGSSVSELWNNVGAKLFPYQRMSGFNIDYGCLNPSTIASGDNFVIWLGINEKSGPVIMYTSGGEAQQISTDGINFKLAQLNKPNVSAGFIFKQDGHLFYQLTFNDPSDNFTLTYDFTTQKFFSLCDNNMDCHIAKRVAAFNNTYYFVSFKDGDLYELNSNYTTNDGEEFPRIRITGAIRSPNNEQYIANRFSLLIEQGSSNESARVDVSTSRDGGIVFGNYVGTWIQPLAIRKNKFVLNSMGAANELILQLRFYGKERFVVSNGLLEIIQS